MIAPMLLTTTAQTSLVPPDIERDVPLSMKWLEGKQGYETLKMMGVAEKDNQPTTLEKEKERVANFIHGKNQLNWMIQHDETIVGSVWVDLESSEYLPSPSVHIMIGDPSARGKGIGRSSLEAVVDYLAQNGERTVYSRYLLMNKASECMLQSLGFAKLGGSYDDEDKLTWQNVSLQVG